MNMMEEEQSIIMDIHRRAADLRRTLMLEQHRLNIEARILLLSALQSSTAHNSAAAQSSNIIWGDRTDSHFIISDNNHNLITQTRTTRRTQQQQQHSFDKIRIQEGEQGSDCSICLTELSLGTEAIRLPNPCSHIYHEHCIMRWLNNSNTCPLCRRPVV